MVTSSRERTGFLADILVTAAEGGINYWALMRNYRWEQDADGNLTMASVEIETRPKNPGPSVWQTVSEETIELGIARVKQPGFQVNRDNLANILVADRENDASEIDSEAADCIIQAALFGEVVYG